MKLLRNYDFRLVSTLRRARRATIGGNATNTRNMFVRTFRRTFGHLRQTKFRPKELCGQRPTRICLKSVSSVDLKRSGSGNRSCPIRPPELIVTLSREGSDQSEMEDQKTRGSEQAVREVMVDGHATMAGTLLPSCELKQSDADKMRYLRESSVDDLGRENNDSLFDCDIAHSTRDINESSSASISFPVADQLPTSRTKKGELNRRHYGSVVSVGAYCDRNLQPTDATFRSRHRKSISADL
ncbi:hypothetical protein FBUS_01864 [Fasciolopsis buskii]|uniref:Uncharacterized protein n=1 Tax=Fasciolopsis buskii TaxID=27845 RepID=A0A8E0RYU8_9TREM|nr:hypothetical protein FBUS_01864 [Fasciolopsis buski]